MEKKKYPKLIKFTNTNTKEVNYIKLIGKRWFHWIYVDAESRTYGYTIYWIYWIGASIIL